MNVFTQMAGAGLAAGVVGGSAMGLYSGLRAERGSFAEGGGARSTRAIVADHLQAGGIGLIAGAVVSTLAIGMTDAADVMTPQSAMGRGALMGVIAGVIGLGTYLGMRALLD